MNGFSGFVLPLKQLLGYAAKRNKQHKFKLRCTYSIVYGKGCAL